MEYGLIGEHLGHSFSKEIHGLIADYDYCLQEVAKEDLPAFLKKAAFKGINVTIPYKEAVIPYLDGIDEGAKLIGAVNTIVNDQGRLFGYNTDYLGMIALFEHAGIEVKGTKALIFGSGGTSKTARAVLKQLGAKEIYVFSRKAAGDYLGYDELAAHYDADIIINTTPCGMYPHNYETITDLRAFEALKGVIDVIYNPLRSSLVRQALALGIKAEGGLYMLVAQAFYAAEKFLNKNLAEAKLQACFNKVTEAKQNIILTGMPGSGKTTIGKALSALLKRPFIDTDEYLVNKYQRSIPEIFANEGEAAFRAYEHEVIKEVSALSGHVIATGGGAILSKKNIDYFKQNGRIYFLDRPLADLLPTEDRPLASTKAAIKQRYQERIAIYRDSADVIIANNDTIAMAIEKIGKEHSKWKY